MARTLGPVRERWWSLALPTVLDRAEHASTCLQALPFHSLRASASLTPVSSRGCRLLAGFSLLPEPVGSSPASPEPGQIWNDKTLTPSMLSWLVSKMKTETSLRNTPDEGISVLPALKHSKFTVISPRVLPSPFNNNRWFHKPSKNPTGFYGFLRQAQSSSPTALQLWQFAESTL